MGGSIVKIALRIALLHHYVAVLIDKDSSERSVAILSCLACNLIGCKKISDMIHFFPLFQVLVFQLIDLFLAQAQTFTDEGCIIPVALIDCFVVGLDVAPVNTEEIAH